MIIMGNLDADGVVAALIADGMTNDKANRSMLRSTLDGTYVSKRHVIVFAPAGGAFVLVIRLGQR
jgi:predicted deacylase